MGAKIVERHFTLDRNMDGPDHSASLEFDDFNKLIIGIRQVEKSLGSDKDRVMSQGEMINRENLAKSLVASRNLKKGDKIVTSGGITGTITRVIDNDKVEVEIAENVTVEVIRGTGVQSLMNSQEVKK